MCSSTYELHFAFHRSLEPLLQSLVVSLHVSMQGIHTILATGSQLLTDIIIPTSCQICLLLWCCLVWLLSFCLCLLQQGKYILCFFSIWLCYCCCAVYFSLSTQCVCGSREGEVLSAPLPWPDWELPFVDISWQSSKKQSTMIFKHVTHATR